MVEMTLVYEGGLHATALHGPSGAAIETDAPIDNQGKGEAFSPTDLLATSLASCMLTTLAIAGEREGWKLDGARARVEKHMQLEPRRRVGCVVVELELPDTLPGAARQRLEEVARGCPVAASLHPDIEVDLTLRWVEIAAASVSFRAGEME
ncbi:MAG TPA: OsmC family peroxiredoxin [Myxococcales bacterium]|nr:OsmC family peroxiredoxin [Myxococcales bacterium]HIL80694.1 OsmC family peroxiredoxin [Myxococcales bacterium]